MEVIPYVLRFLLLAQHYHHLCGISNEINSLLLLTSQPMFKYKTKILPVTLDLVWQHDNADFTMIRKHFFPLLSKQKERRGGFVVGVGLFASQNRIDRLHLMAARSC